jgi:hypothetical protein
LWAVGTAAAPEAFLDPEYFKIIVDKWRHQHAPPDHTPPVLQGEEEDREVYRFPVLLFLKVVQRPRWIPDLARLYDLAHEMRSF